MQRRRAVKTEHLSSSSALTPHLMDRQLSRGDTGLGEGGGGRTWFVKHLSHN